MPDPFLKWVGGKRWMVNRYPSLFPTHYERYIEPFLGSGSVFFYIMPQKAILADKNEELINAYKVVKCNHNKIELILKKYHRLHCKKFYYSIRAHIPKSKLGRAVRFIYLNRVCFNGIYRVNRKGEFNVPMGTKTEVAYPPGLLQEVSHSLRRARIMVMDFEQTLSMAGEGDFVYLDPPYTVMHNNNNFIKYNDTLFSWHDQKRLARTVREAASRGAFILISNADNPSIHALYKNFGVHSILNRCSVLASSPNARKHTTEMAIANYNVGN